MTEIEVVELRVHGVSGTPPDQLLDCPLITQEAGDGSAGFYKPRLCDEERDPRCNADGTPATSGPWLEGYAWGGLTSGAPSRALWLLLLPFTLLNVAPRLRPASQPRPLIWVLWLVNRLLALAMTVLIVSAVAGVSVDLFGWQCRTGTHSTPNCGQASPKWLMRPLLDMSVEHRLVLGAVVPLAILFLLWKLSGRTINNYEAVKIKSPGLLSTEENGADEIETGLTSLWMWDNEQQVRRLRHLHLQAGMSTILWIVSYPFEGAWDGWRIWITIAIATYIVAMLCCPAYTGRRKSATFRAINMVVWSGLLVDGVFIGLALLNGHPVPTPATHEGLPGYAGSVLLIFGVQLILWVLFAILIAVMAGIAYQPQNRRTPRALWHLGAVVMSLLGIFLGAVFSAGVYVFASGWLTTGSLKPGFKQLSNASEAFDIPNSIRDADRAYAVSLAALVVMIAVLVLVVLANQLIRLPRINGKSLRPTPSKSYRALLVAAYGKQAVDSDKEGRTKQVGKAFWLARQVDFAHRYLAAVVAVGAVISAFFTGLLFASERTPKSSNCFIRWHEYGNPGRHDVTSCTATSTGVTRWLDGFLSARSLQGTGAYLVVMSLVLLVGLGAAAFRAAGTRKSVGILWDLASFWPRSAHPFAAPCYAERAVPDLVTRICWYVKVRKEGRRSVVIAAHSQGTVISAATMFQLETIDAANADDEVLPSVAFMSFGCVLRRLYARYFPAYFSTDALTRLRDDVLTSEGGKARWRNLWRYTDYLGGQVMAGPPPVEPPASEIDIMCTDPLWARPDGDTRWSAPSRHSDYWRDPMFAKTVGDLAAMLPAVAVAEKTMPSKDE